MPGGIAVNVLAAVREPLEAAVVYLLYKQQGAGTIRLAKLLYLAELVHFRRFGKPLTGAEFIRCPYGPYAPALPRACEQLHARQILEEECVQTGDGYICHLKRPALQQASGPMPTPYAAEVLEEVLREWAGRPTSQLVAFTKQTRPYQSAREGERIDFRVGASVPFSEPQDIDWEALVGNLTTAVE